MPAGLPPIARRLFAGRRQLQELIRQARLAAAERHHLDAAFLYEEALRHRPGQARWRVQAGHMRKEAGDLEAAAEHYRIALERLPHDADLALQRGHFEKLRGNVRAAEAEYRRALWLKPAWTLPIKELAALHAKGWGTQEAAKLGDRPGQTVLPQPDHAEFEAADGLAQAWITRDLIHRLAPKQPRDLLHAHSEQIDIRRLGTRERGYWGFRRTLRGAEAIRGFCLSRSPVLEAQVLLNGLTIARSPVEGGYRLPFEIDPSQILKYVFNIWVDFSHFTPGLHRIEVRLRDAVGNTHGFQDQVVIAAPLHETDYPRLDGVVEVDPADPRPIEEQIRTRPSMVRNALRETFPQGIKSLLVMRTDQLGDLVASVPALRRLRELLPDTKIVGLLTDANAELARSLHLFDAIEIADFPDDAAERRRVMPLDEQERLRERLRIYDLDVAIDLAHSDVSRELLRLSGAKFLYGFGGGDWPWLSAEFQLNTRDRLNRGDIVPHSTRVLALIEAFGAIATRHAPIIRRDDLPVGRLAAYGIAGEDRYVILHTGARLKFSRWPHFTELARRLIEATDLKVIMISDGPDEAAQKSEATLPSSRFTLLQHRLEFEDFDLLVSRAVALVGNDSGPKHLASLRGTPAVTLFTARLNWTEWGQEEVGKIISRRVPCQGCAIFHDPEECGKGFACIRDIKVEEVFDTLMTCVQKG